MGESEYIDLFQNNDQPGGPGLMGQPSYGFDDPIYSPGRSRINDYKHSSSTIQKGQVSYSNGMPGANAQPEKKKNLLNLSDERLVWAGAIFVFFGVLVFLVGYWLGKTTMKDVTFANQNAVQNVQEKLDQKKIENTFGMNAPVSADSGKPSATEARDTTALPEGATLTPPSLPKEESVTAPPISASPKPAAPARTSVKLTTSSAKKNKTVSAKPASKPAAPLAVGGDNYTLQISAHTSMDKARSIEDQLRRQGYQSYIVEASVNGVTYYRVRVGKFGTKQDAQNALARIKTTTFGRDSYLLNLN